MHSTHEQVRTCDRKRSETGKGKTLRHRRARLVKTISHQALVVVR